MIQYNHDDNCDSRIEHKNRNRNRNEGRSKSTTNFPRVTNNNRDVRSDIAKILCTLSDQNALNVFLSLAQKRSVADSIADRKKVNNGLKISDRKEDCPDVIVSLMKLGLVEKSKRCNHSCFLTNLGEDVYYFIKTIEFVLTNYHKFKLIDNVVISASQKLEIAHPALSQAVTSQIIDILIDSKKVREILKEGH